MAHPTTSPRQAGPGLRGRLQQLAAVLALAALLLPSVVSLPADAQSQGQLDELEDDIQDAEAQADEIEAQLDVSLAELDVILADLEVLQTQLNELNTELGIAEANLADTERTLAATSATLVATESRLDQARTDLEAQQTTHNSRVRQAYVNQRLDSTLPVLTADSVSEYSQASRYIEAIIRSDRAGVEQIDVLRDQVQADEEELVRLTARQEVEQQEAEVERDRVGGLVEQQEALVAEVESRAADKQTVLEGLQNDKDSAEALIGRLEAESAQIEAELKAAAEAAAAAAAAAAQSSSPGGGSSAPAVSPPVSGSGRFIYPVNGRISSNYGYRIHPISGASRLHAGMDIAAGSGTPIAAAGSGTVIFSGWRGGYGNCTMIDHGGGIVTLYGHQSQLAAGVGTAVSTGQVIGYVGSTGYSTGPHLHWEVRVNGTPQDPRGYV